MLMQFLFSMQSNENSKNIMLKDGYNFYSHINLIGMNEQAVHYC